MSVTTTLNYGFSKNALGHPLRDTAMGDNLDMIDAAIRAQSYGIVTVPMSFETGEQSATKIFFQFAVNITRIRSIVMKEVAATDDGTIVCANSVGNSDTGTLTFTPGTAVNAEDKTIPTSRNHVDADSYYKLTSSKPTAGGKVLVTLEYERT